MENNSSAIENVQNIEQDALFGISSAEINEAWDGGALHDVYYSNNIAVSFDKDQIVNQQDQLDIVNPSEEEREDNSESPVVAEIPVTKASEIIEREKIPGDKEMNEADEKTVKPAAGSGNMD